MEAQLEDTVAKDLNFGRCLELVKAKDFLISFSAENFEIKPFPLMEVVNIPSKLVLQSKATASSRSTTVDAYQYLNDGDELMWLPNLKSLPTMDYLIQVQLL